ncbi:hypothetical protein XA68_14336 [Ophiocordyceps unilateralis]|uniref:Uncharacterized protein n=1 Tax=Ophiocordyceps unilateralis TaxID=268505 RepID=A0A2A9PAL2_OPHUN|nr:hypothetical protein XA68_14336 [Ophiocordyceps unilateralis]
MQPADQRVVPGPFALADFFETSYTLLIGYLPRASPAQTAGSMHTSPWRPEVPVDSVHRCRRLPRTGSESEMVPGRGTSSALSVAAASISRSVRSLRLEAECSGLVQLVPVPWAGARPEGPRRRTLRRGSVSDWKSRRRRRLPSWVNRFEKKRGRFGAPYTQSRFDVNISGSCAVAIRPRITDSPQTPARASYRLC